MRNKCFPLWIHGALFRLGFVVTRAKFSILASRRSCPEMKNRRRHGLRDIFKSLPGPTAPMVICLTSGADDLPRRIAEIEALAITLNGEAAVHAVSGCTTALRVCVPGAHAARFTAALTLAGATQLDAAAEALGPEFLVLLTLEPQPQPGAST